MRLPAVAVLFVSCVTSTPHPTAPPAPPPPPPAATVDAGQPVTPPLDAGPSAPPDAGPAFVPATGGKPITARKLWSTKLEGLGVSSPRTVDLNGDGVLDLVVGAGVQTQRGWVYAVDGATGALLWKAEFKDEIYATPTLMDVNGDGVPDVFIGGRDFDWAALNGKDGTKLWTLRAANPKAVLPKRNFNGALVVADQDGDGVEDLVVSQGGSGDDSNRLPGRVMVISAAHGALLFNSALPDARETYAVPALVSAKPLEIVLGTGSESVGGHLYRLGLQGDKATAAWAFDSGKKGVVASALLTRIGGTAAAIDGFYDGRIVRVDLETGQVRWQARQKDFEVNASPAPGRFGGSSDVDVVVASSKGAFPVYNFKNVITWIDGETGAVLDEAVSGVFSSASPIVADFDRDGLDETLTLSMDSFETMQGSVISTLTIFDGARGKKKRLELKVRGAGSATPAVADLDHDAKLDLVLVYFGVVERYALELPGGPTPTVRWGGFRGPAFTGVDSNAPPAR